jgi:hypothetical protein
MVLGVIFGLVILPIALVVMWNDVFQAIASIRWGRLFGRRPAPVRAPQGEPRDAWQTLTADAARRSADP